MYTLLGQLVVHVEARHTNTFAECLSESDRHSALKYIPDYLQNSPNIYIFTAIRDKESNIDDFGRILTMYNDPLNPTAMKKDFTIYLVIIAVLSALGVTFFFTMPVIAQGKVILTGANMFGPGTTASHFFFAFVYVLCTILAALCYSNKKATNLMRNILIVLSTLMFMIHILDVLSSRNIAVGFARLGSGFWFPAVIAVINLALSNQVKPELETDQEEEIEPQLPGTTNRIL